MSNLNNETMKQLLETMVQNGVARAHGEKFLLSASAWKYLNGVTKDPVPTPPTYEIEVNFDEADK
jgi:hypothetical protein